VFGMSWAEIMIILAVGMFVLGPERIPVAVKWVGSTLRTVRTMAAGAQEQLRGEFGPELEELRRQVADLQSLKEIQDLRKLRDLNPRAMLTKNILGEEFSGGIGGILGLNDTAPTKSTGSGVAPELADLAFGAGEPVAFGRGEPVETSEPSLSDPMGTADIAPGPFNGATPALDLNKATQPVAEAGPAPSAGRPAPASYDIDAT